MEVTTTYLEMLTPPPRESLSAASGIAIIHARMPTVDYYRFLYDAVGRHWQWVDRKKLSDAELAAIIHNPLVEVHVMFIDGVPAGYVELDRRIAGAIELAYFGLTPEFLGRGLGKFFLAWSVDRAWSYHPRRVWVHTCTLDHQAALPSYQNAGFQIYKVETKEQ